MDSYRDYPSDLDPQAAPDAPAVDDVVAAIGTDERRMHVRAYNYWVSLLEGRDFPSIEDLEPGDVADFSPHSVLLDFTCGVENPAMPYLGEAVRDECGLDDDMRMIGDVPSRSLLSRLTDHYMQIIANRAPVGFEAEFQNQRDENICYRGILMPFSSDGDAIDFIYGVINWKKVGEVSEVPAFAPAPNDGNEDILELGADDTLEPTALDQAEAEAPRWYGQHSTRASIEQAAVAHFSWEDGPLADAESDAVELPGLKLDENAGLADRLWAARETAESVKAGEGRTRAALYRALALAYDFAIAAQENPTDYAELLEESGVKAQARAPMTPIVKLVFGVDYDKARLTEFAAALSYAQGQDVPAGQFRDFIEKQHGGLKALVAAQRQARRPEDKPDTRGEIARARLRHAVPISLAELPSADEFAVVITRRGADGHYEPVAILNDESLIERAIRKSA